MKCLRCGYCCIKYAVIIVDDPSKGISKDNLKTKEEGRCQHLRGDKPGEYSCVIHNEGWYSETPCFNHGQIEKSLDTECRMGRYILDKMLDNA